MRLRILFILCLLFFTFNSAYADIMTELAKRDRRNAIWIYDITGFGLYAENGYLITGIWNDGMDEASIVAYQMQEDIIKLIIRVKTWDFAYRMIDFYYNRDRADDIIVDVHNYYLIELVYNVDKLETYCNRIMDINTNRFTFNDAKIGSNILKVPDYYYPTYPGNVTDLKEGQEVKIVSFTNIRTNDMKENSYKFEAYDYYYQILVDDKQERINGYLLEFENKIEYHNR